MVVAIILGVMEAHGDGARAVENVGGHEGAVFGEGAGEVPDVTPRCGRNLRPHGGVEGGLDGTLGQAVVRGKVGAIAGRLIFGWKIRSKP